MYFKKTPLFIRKMFPKIYWRFEDSTEVFLSFDDGPHPESTPELLALLDSYNIKATFFLIGERVELYPNLFQLIQDNGHTIGFHGQQHLSGWQTSTKKYISNTHSKKISTKLFRPPFGRLKWSQYKVLVEQKKVIMWDLMPGDFEQEMSQKDCFENIKKHLGGGSIIALHDTPIALQKLNFVIPNLSNLVKRRALTFGTIRESLIKT